MNGFPSPILAGPDAPVLTDAKQAEPGRKLLHAGTTSPLVKAGGAQTKRHDGSDTANRAFDGVVVEAGTVDVRTVLVDTRGTCGLNVITKEA